YLSTLIADDSRRFAGIERGSHLHDLRFSGNCCRRTVDRRTIVGPSRPANAHSRRALHFRCRHDLVCIRRGSCKYAGWQIDTSVRCMRDAGTFTCDCARSVRWAGARKSNGIDDDRNRSRPRLFTIARQRARSLLWLAIGICFCGNFRICALLAYSALVGETNCSAGGSVNPLTVGTCYLGLIRDDRFVAPARIAGLTMAGLFAIFSAAPRVLLENFALSPVTLGLLFAGLVLVVFGASMLAPRLSAWLGLYRATLVGLGATAVGAVALLFA